MSEQDYNSDSMIFNMSIAMLRRIDQILTACAISSRNRDVGGWFNNLNVLRREVNYMFNEKEIAKNKEHISKITGFYNNYIHAIEQDKLKDFSDFGKFYNALEEYETFLKTALYERDMLAIKKEDLTKVMLR
jgi:hypothetical protein